MIKKYVGMLVAAGFAGTIALACTVSTTPGGSSGASGGTPDTDSGTPKTDSGVVAKDSSVPKTDGAVTSGDGGPDSCYDAKRGMDASTGLVFKEAVLDQGKCTPADITGLIAACFKTGATQADCTKFVGVKGAPLNAACVNCASAALNPDFTGALGQTLPLPAVLQVGQYSLLQIEACAVTAAKGPAGCAKSVSDNQFCGYAACNSCMDPTPADKVVEECLVKADAEACKVTVPNKACVDAINAAPTDKCLGNAKTFVEALPIVIKAFCGTP
jgi:hypothetical protein